MLITFLKSLALGELVVSKGVTVGEMLKVFEYENVTIAGACPSRVSLPSGGVAFTKRMRCLSDSVTNLCERVADAIVQWPRLETTLDGVMAEGFNRSEFVSTFFTTTATRAWIRFAEPPKTVEDDSDRILSLVTNNPGWMVEGLTSLGALHYRMSIEDPTFGKLRNEASFNKLLHCVESDSLGCFFSIKFDACRLVCNDNLLKELCRGDKFYKEMRHALMHNTEIKPYARAVVKLVDDHRASSPICGKVFSGACADENGSTPERTALRKALKSRGVTVVRWMEYREPTIRPLVFPPSWREKGERSCHGPSVLLSFENIL